MALALAALGSGSCTVQGTALGTYGVTGTLDEDTCGGAPSPWTFEVMLTRDGATLYWNWLDASPLLSGPLTGDGNATLTAYEVDNVDATDAGMGPCDLQRNDDIEVSLGTAPTPASFSGTLSYSFRSQEGANCSDQLTSSGGGYRSLPCTIGYTISAKRQ